MMAHSDIAKIRADTISQIVPWHNFKSTLVPDWWAFCYLEYWRRCAIQHL